MKIKKVEISAFRVFDDVENSTFDFTLNETIANFVSIYAPNGYGKTSFYDAVEWAVTGQIERFRRNAAENAKAGKENRKHSKQYLLQHNGQDELGFVEVYTNKNHSFPRRNISTTTVYDFKKEAENNYFKDVILSQELIDCFIKEEKANERYKKFVANIPHLNLYNTALQNIVKLIENLDGELKNLKSQKKNLENKQQQFDLEDHSTILEEINKAIGFLIDKKEALSIIDENSFTKAILTSLTQKVDSAITMLQEDIKELVQKTTAIEAAYEGVKNDDNKIGIIEYYSNIKKLKEFTKKIDQLKNFLNAIVQKETAEKTKLALSEKLSEQIKIIDEAQKIKNKYNRYETIDNNIKDLNNKVEANKIIVAQEKKELKELEITLSKLESEEPSLKQTLINNKNEKAKIPLLDKGLNQINKDENTYLSEISNIVTSIKANKELLVNHNNNIGQQNAHLSLLKNDIQLLLEDEMFRVYETKIKQTIESNKKVGELEKQLSVVNLKISEQQNLNTELKALISKGLELIAENRETSCPLCLTDHKTYEELSNKISGNPLLNDLLKNSLIEKGSLESQIKDIKISISLNKNEIEDFIKEFILKEENDRDKINVTLDQLNTQLDLKQKNLAKSKVQKDEIKDQINKITGIDIQTSTNKLEIISNQISDTKSKIDKINQSVNTNIKQLKIYNENIQQEQNSNDFKEVVDYFKETIKSNSITLENLNVFMQKSQTDKINVQNKIKAAEIKIIRESELLRKSSLSNDELNNEIDSHIEKKLSHDKKKKNFEKYIQSNFDIDLESLNEEDATSQFKNLEKQQLNKVSNLNDMLKYYKVVEKLKDKVFDFVENKELKDEINKIGNEINQYEKVKTKLVEEKSNLETYLKKTINDFFYSDLINKIYLKIDPHPNNYKIEFDCEFNDRNPRLQIYTLEGDGKRSVPALYFSTAQINILSLSIFLARALKASNPSTKEEIKCIFIDDPVQSMDSINILSFIDLFRSLTINLDRQIIIATHEENFHLLLQKKIPKHLFKSKFIQFETFGQLEENTVD